MPSLKHSALLGLLLLISTLHAQSRKNIYRILNNEKDALQCRIDLIQQAGKGDEVLLSTYIIRDDIVGLTMLQLLAEAEQRGAVVHLLVDDLGNRLPNSLLRYLEEIGVENRTFNIRHWAKFRTMVDRMHGKMLITQQKNMIIGGRNLKEQYYTLDSVSNFLDREVLVLSDSAVAEARRHFYSMWDYRQLTNHKRKGKLSEEQRHKWKTAMAVAPAALRRRIGISLQTQRDWTKGVEPADNPVHFVHDNFYRKEGKKRIRKPRKDSQCTRELIALVDSAKISLDIENAYFSPTYRWWKALKRASNRGVRIRLLTNSAYSNDVPLLQAVYRYKRKRYLRAGIEIWEYWGKKMLHTKAMVIDGHISMVGSYNLDVKSQRFNTEVAVWVDDGSIAATHLQLMDHNLALALPAGDVREKVHTYSEKDMPAKSDLEKKRKRRVNLFRFTIAPLADFFF